MALAWPTDRISWRGLLAFVCAAAAIPAGALLWQRGGLVYNQPRAVWHPLFAAGTVALVAGGVATFLLVRRREYPWLVALAAIALPFFDPSVAPYEPNVRAVVAVRDLALILAVAAFIIHAIRRSDELERRIQFEALAFSYGLAVILLVLSAEAADVLRLRGTWIASAMLGTWFCAWLLASYRYQR